MCTTQFTIDAFKKLSDKSSDLARTTARRRALALAMWDHWQERQCPVVNVDSADVDVITAALDKLINEASFYRLPTEHEWEWAAFGGEDFEYAGCTNWEKVAWCKPNSENKAHPVKLKKANGYGLYDMSGNVWEWTSSNEGSSRVRRGGCWYRDPRLARVAYRLGGAPSYRYDLLGFRLCFTQPSNWNS
jgi:formylglycine-generating enzyme required for sulfatase activity